MKVNAGGDPASEKRSYRSSSDGLFFEKLGTTIFPYLTTVEGVELAAQTFHIDIKTTLLSRVIIKKNMHLWTYCFS